MTEQKPWLKHKKWANNQISSQSKTGLYVICVFAIVWNLISLSIVFNDDIIHQTPDTPEKFAVLLFPLIGLVLIISAIRSIVSWRKFGSTPLTLDPFPSALGGHLGGFIETNIPYNEALNFKVTAQCIKSYMSGTDKNRSRNEKSVWQSEGICFSEPHKKMTRLSFRFSPPNTLPESEEKCNKTYHLWRINIECKLPGADFNRQFEVPVYKSNNLSKLIKESTENFHKTLEHAQDGLNTIAQVRNIPNGIEIKYPAFKRPAAGIFATIFGIIFSSIAVFLSQTEAVIILPISFGAVGLLITSFGLWDLGKSLKVVVTTHEITSRRFFLNYPIATKKIAQNTLSKISVKEGSSVSHGKTTTRYYSLYAHTLDNKKIVIAERLTSRPEVNLLKEAIETYATLSHEVIP